MIKIYKYDGKHKNISRTIRVFFIHKNDINKNSLLLKYHTVTAKLYNPSKLN